MTDFPSYFISQMYCSIEVMAKTEGDNFETLAVINGFENDGTLSESPNWRAYSVELPSATERVKIVIEYGRDVGGAGLDDVIIRSDQKCFPRWIKVEKTQFIDSLTNFEPSMDNFELSGITPEMLEARHGMGFRGGISLERCSRLCSLGGACDVFEFNSTDGKCRFFPHSSFKDKLWPNFSRDSGDPMTSMYVAQCTGTGLRNVLPFPRSHHLPPSLWTVASPSGECDSRRVNRPPESDLEGMTSAVHGKHSVLMSHSCSSVPGNVSIKTNVRVSRIDEQSYLDIFNPVGLAQTWVRFQSATNSTANHEAAFKLGSRNETLTLPLSAETHLLTLFVVGNSELSNLFRNEEEIEFSALINDDVEVQISPIEFLLDFPTYVGCFEDENLHVSSPPSLTHAEMTPEKCLIRCSILGGSRTALISMGNECRCFDASSFAERAIEMCEKNCPSKPGYKCGSGEETLFSAYSAACLTGEKKFGENCFFEASSADEESIESNFDLCSDQVNHGLSEAGEASSLDCGSLL